MRTIALKLDKEAFPLTNGCKYIFAASDTELIINRGVYKMTYLIDLIQGALQILLVDDYNILPSDFHHGEPYINLTERSCTVTTRLIERCGQTGLVISSINVLPAV